MSTYTMSDIEETITIEDPMTKPQRKYIADLWEGKDHTGVVLPPLSEMTRQRAHELIDLLKTFPWKPKAPVVVAQAITEAGMYKVGDTIYKVQQALYGSLHLYAKRLVVVPAPTCRGHYDTDGSYFECGQAWPTTEQERLSRNGLSVPGDEWPVRDWGCGEVKPKIEFVYEAGAMHKITAADRLTKEDAKAFGALYSTCVYCARTLTDERSIDAGYGQTCAANNGLPWGEK